jgi:ABC-type nitrate/sulfonate/bicarbonate transport system permease component
MAAPGLSASRGTFAIRLATLAALAATWEALARSGIVFKGVTPSLVAIAAALAAELASGAFYRHLAVTAAEVAAGFAIGAVPGILLGIAFGARRALGAAADPYVAALATTPKIVFLPIVMLLVGIGPGSKVALGALSAIFPILIATAAGVRAIPPVYLRVGRALKLASAPMIRHVYLPALALPILAGMRLGLGVCIIGVLLGELKFSNAGLGFLANDYYTQFRIAELYALIALIFALAALANGAMSRLAARAAPGR